MGHVATLATLLLLKFWSAVGLDEDLIYVGCYAIHKGVSKGSTQSVEECSEKCNTNYFAVTFSNNCLCGDEFSWSVPFEQECKDCEETIRLCRYNEVYYARRINLALGRPTKQSSDYWEWDGLYTRYFTSNLAVDGNKNSDFDKGKSCSHTYNNNPWFAVNLRSMYKIEKVIITNRNGHYGFRLNGFKVFLTNESFDSWDKSTNIETLNVVLCNQFTAETQSIITLEIKCKNSNISSRYVVVTLPGEKENLAICEIEVFERDINECDKKTPEALIPGRCNLTTTKCMNFDGGYKCDCISNGFQQITSDSFNCYDIDECRAATHICDTETTTCANEFGSYECFCKEGFVKKNNISCEDINECLLYGLCDGNTTKCNNIPGSYQCECLSGFENKDGSITSSCSDIDECNTTNSCPSTGYCLNTFGSYGCYTNDGKVITNKTANYMFYIMYGIIVIFLALIVSMAYVAYRRVQRNKKLLDITAEKENIINLVDLSSKPVLRRKEADVEPTYMNLATSIGVNRIPVEKLADRIQALERDDGYSKEYKAIPEVAEASTDYAKNPKLKPKNRFKNIHPYDINRVELSVQCDTKYSDYINASHIQNYDIKWNIIAAQGPLVKTVNDFWQMITEQNVTVVVMLTQFVENNKKKCFKYWSDSSAKVYGHISVKKNSEIGWESYVKRELELTNGQTNETRQLIHWHYKAWPDHGTPAEPANFLKFRSRVRHSFLDNSRSGKILVHCSAGVGRTGCYIAIDNLIDEAEKEKSIDVVACVTRLRQQRPFMVQTLEQYKFIYAALLESLTYKNTCVPIDSFIDVYTRLTTMDQNNRNGLMSEFERLDKSDQSKAADENGPDITEIVQTGDVSASIYVISDEISPDDFFLKCYERLPLVLSVSQNEEYKLKLFQMLDKNSISSKDVVVQILEKLKNGSNWVMKLGLFALSKSKSSPTNFYENISFVRSKSSNMKILNLIETTDSHSRSAFGQQFMNLMNLIKDNMPEDDQVIFIVSNDPNISGFYTACYQILEQMSVNQEVDIFETVANVRRCVPGVFKDFTLYHKLYELVRDLMAGKPIRNGPS